MMKREYVKLDSPVLGRPMELLVFGDTGKPVLVFPTSQGRFFDYENFGMIDALASHINRGLVKVYCVDSIDSEAWFSRKPPEEKAKRATEYDSFIAREIVPFIHERHGSSTGLIVHGCSFGAYHAVNFYLRHPELADTCISLSGSYSIRFAVGDFRNDEIYYHDPLMYVPNIRDPLLLERIRRGLIILCAGQGAWEAWNHEARALSHSLSSIGVPHLLDFWGHDVEHHWYWWKRQIVYFLDIMAETGLLEPSRRLEPSDVKRFLMRFGRA